MEFETLENRWLCFVNPHTVHHTSNAMLLEERVYVNMVTSPGHSFIHRGGMVLKPRYLSIQYRWCPNQLNANMNQVTKEHSCREKFKGKIKRSIDQI